MSLNRIGSTAYFMGFGELGLSQKLIAAIREAGYQEPTPIQALAVPAAIAGHDICGIAQTGTGKTAAFVIPMLQRLEGGRTRARMPRAVVIEPTRELAAQVADSLLSLNSQHGFSLALLTGGASFDDQIRKLDRGVDILIATPGRLLDHFERGKLLLTSIQYFVIDEVDRLLDIGFIPDVEKICAKLPISRQTLLFSATMPSEIQKLANGLLHNPKQIEITPAASTAVTVVQTAVAVPDDPRLKQEALRSIINHASDLQNSIVFCNRKRDVKILFSTLKRHNLNIYALHGDMEQSARIETLEDFRNSEKAILVASDIAARGLDIDGISHVFNFDVPTHPEDYVHRIGRTGRAGHTGTAITLVTPKEHKSLESLKRIIQTPILWQEDIPGIPFSDTGNPGTKPQPSRDSRRKTKSSVQEALSGPKDVTPSESRVKHSPKEQEIVSPHGRNTRKNRGHGREREKEPEETPLGMGDHFPAFLALRLNRD